MAKRIGGHLVAESLAALGAEVAFGVPGVHALAIWEGLRDGGGGAGSRSTARAPSWPPGSPPTATRAPADTPRRCCCPPGRVR